MDIVSSSTQDKLHDLDRRKDFLTTEVLPCPQARADCQRRVCTASAHSPRLPACTVNGVVVIKLPPPRGTLAQRTTVKLLTSLRPGCRTGQFSYQNMDQGGNSLIMKTQSTLEQHGFELHRSTYMQIFFNKYYKCTFSSLGFS